MLCLDNVLSLKCDEQVDPQLRYVSNPPHQTDAALAALLLAPGAQLKRTLLDANTKQTCTYVASYQRCRVW